MRRTPPVVVQLQPQWPLQLVVAGIAVLATAGLAGWAFSHRDTLWPALLATPVSALCAWRAACVLPRRLRWDGQAWWLAEPGRDDETAVQLAVLINLDVWLLLRATPGPRWLPLARCQQSAQWGALRATLFSAPAAASHDER